MKRVIVLVGPTGVGKTDLSIELAEKLSAPIVSADSRQIYKELRIGTMAPTEEQVSRVPHYLVNHLPKETAYNASRYEEDALKIIEQLHQTTDTVIVTGGSMMYLDALCNGIDELPTIDPELRQNLEFLYKEKGIEEIRSQLKMLDPIFYEQVDLKNPKRVIHALEICLMTGMPYSSLRTNRKKERYFQIYKFGLTRNREELYRRIDARVDEMIKEGLLEEAEMLFPAKHLNSLNTVGYKELFEYFEGKCTLEFAIDKIKQHSRNYARKQMTWFKKSNDIHWFNLSEHSSEYCLNRIYNIVIGNS